MVLLALFAAPTVWGLRRVLAGIDHVDSEARRVVDEVARLNMVLTAIEIELYRLQLGQEKHLDTLVADVDAARELIDDIGEHYVIREPGAEPFHRALVDEFPAFMRQVSSLATAQDPGLARKYNVEALSTAMALRENVAQIYQHAVTHTRAEQSELIARFRWLVVGIALGCLLVITVSIMLLLRAGQMVLRPLGELVRTSREMTHEGSLNRSLRAGADEFTQLAAAYRSLGDQLEAHEERRMETLQQTAVMLNHELNTAMTAIEGQLEVMKRRTGNAEQFEACLRSIRESIHRMANTVESLKHIKRIVLTDYIEGVKMLDLKQSTRAAGAQADPPPSGVPRGR